MRRYVLGKDTLRLFPIRAKQSTRYGGQPEERFANRNQKKCSALVCLDKPFFHCIAESQSEESCKFQFYSFWLDRRL